MTKEKQHIHFIGICGVAMSALAIAFHKKNWKVTGSDAGFYPPVSTNLQKTGIDFYSGWHVEKMCSNGDPDLVVVGNVASSNNPEWQYVKEHGLNYKSYPEVIAEFFVAKNSIVCAGTYGKTTTSTLLSWILSRAGHNPSYMFGGLAVNHNFDSAGLGKEDKKDWSVLEGDEYKTARWDNSPKFTHYSPTHLLLTAVQWDHADVFPTEESYFDAFKKLAQSIPNNGLAVVSENVKEDFVAKFGCPVIKYGTSNQDYQYQNLTQAKDGLKFEILHHNHKYQLFSPLLGGYMAENITACFAMACEIGIEPEQIIKYIAEFQGIKRRLEKRSKIEINVFDDIAHSPAKAGFTLQTLRQAYAHSQIYAVFEPNTGNRRPQSAHGYSNAFINTDQVIIPRLTKVKINQDDPDRPMDGKKLAEVIAQTHANVKYIEDDQKLLDYLKTKTQPGDVVVFLGSHGFRGMIEEFVE
ncbi:MAG: Mur ligase family protein [bacterium]